MSEGSPDAPAREAPYRIRPARREDIPALVGIEEAAFDPTTYGGFLMNARDFRRHIANQNILLVAETNTPEAIVAGYALGFVRKDSPYVRFLSLAVGPEHGGRGAAWRLFAELEKEGKARGLKGVRLEIREDNTRLLARYERQGYKVFAREPGYYSDGAASIRMFRDFPP